MSFTILNNPPNRQAKQKRLCLKSKQDGANNNVKKLRVCIDPRILNKHINAPDHPIPDINTIFDNLGGSTIFSCIDLTEGFLQLPLKEEDRSKTAFIWKSTQYQFKRAPFGLKHLTAHFQRFLSNLFQDMPKVLVYVDDIIIHSQNTIEHETHVLEVLKRLNRHNLRINLRKCRLALKKIDVLGFTIDSDGIYASEQKLLAISRMRTPTNTKEVQSLLGFANYFRKFVPGLADLCAPLDKLRNAPFSWGPEETKILERLKLKLLQMFSLTYPRTGHPYHVDCDASDVGMGAALYQVIDGKPHYISFASRTFKKAERNYEATRKEFSAILFALDKFHHYLAGQKFILHSDHEPLSYLQSKKKLSKTLLNQIAKINEYDHHIDYIRGAVNVVADTLSRLPVPMKTTTTPHNQEKRYLRRINNEDQFNSTALQEISEHTSEPIDKLEEMHLVHQLGHCGAKTMEALLKARNISWNNMSSDCHAFVQSCTECCQVDWSINKTNPIQPVLASKPWDHLQIDLISGLPTHQHYKYVLVIVDVFSGYTILRPLSSKHSKKVANTLLDIFWEYGFPRIVQSDNGKEFVNQVVEELLQLLNVEHRLSTRYHPEANGRVERQNRTALAILKKLLNKHEDWSTLLGRVQFCMNLNPRNRTGLSPFQLAFLRQPSDPVQAVKRADTNLAHQVSLWNNTARSATQVWNRFAQVDHARHQRECQQIDYRKKAREQIRVNDMVIVEDPVSKERSGPFQVTHISKGGAYTVKGKKFARKHLRPVGEPPQI